jgi:hypothetical protein
MNMKYFKGLFAVMIVLCISVSGAYAEEPAAAPAPDVTGSVSFSGLNKYVFRGAELSAKSIVLQPSITVNYKGFSLNAWGNIDTDQHATQVFAPGKDGSGEGQKSFNETDLTLSYTYAINKLSLTGGYIYYGTEYAQQTQELYASVSYDMIAHPTLSVYRDIDAYPGWYVNLSFSQSFPVVKIPTGDVTVDLGASFGYYNISGNGMSTYSALHDGMLKAGLTIPVAKNVVVQPIMQYWYPLSGKAHHSDPNTDNNPAAHIDNTFVYGIGVTLSF